MTSLLSGKRRGRIWKYSIVLLGAAAVALLYFLLDPADYLWMPKCPVKMATGLDCPGCGSQRFLHALLHGDLQSAWDANAMLFIGLPYAFLLTLADIRRRRNPRLFRILYGSKAIIAVGVAIIIWSVIRNL